MPARVSVVVPVYKVEEYLPRCLRSLEEQTIFSKMEVILVNDGSPDRCGEICAAFAHKHPNARVIHKENGGVSSARNAGIDIATGRFIAFLDSDDFVRADTYELASSALDEYDADFAVFGLRSVRNDDEPPREEVGPPTVIEGDEIFGALAGRRNGMTEGSHDKLYRREIFDGLRFVPGKKCEDALLMPYIAMRARRLVVLKDVLYFYRKNPNSIMNTRGDLLPRDRVEAHEQIARIAAERYPRFADEAFARMLYMRILTLNVLLDAADYRHSPCWDEQIHALRAYLPAIFRARSCGWLPLRRRLYAAALAVTPDIVFHIHQGRIRQRRRAAKCKRK